MRRDASSAVGYCASKGRRPGAAGPLRVPARETVARG